MDSLHVPLDAQLVAGSVTQDWLAHMILAVKTVAAGADFFPVPYIRAAFGTVVILLETVDKMKKNRDDLRELCASTVEIVLLLQDQISTQGHLANPQFMRLCENFIAFLRFLQSGLEKLIQRRAGFRGRFKELLRATSVGDQIERYRARINELRSNFLLVTTIDTNLSVAGIQKSMSALHDPLIIASQFRHIAMGDINLLYETTMSSTVYKIKIFTARIAGELSSMTVAKYEEDDNEKWRRDLELYSRFRHPKVWQLFGISTAPGLNALIFHEELIPLPTYRKFHRPTSDLVWICMEGMLFTQFQNCTEYHHWFNGSGDGKELGATICVKREPVQLCLTMLGVGVENEAAEDLENDLSSWHTTLFQHPKPAAETLTVSNILTTQSSVILSEMLARHLDWNDFFAVLIPIRFPKPARYEMQTKVFLGSAVTQRCASAHFVPVAYLPHSSRVRLHRWELQLPQILHPNLTHADYERFTFLPGSFPALDIPQNCVWLSSSVTFDSRRGDGVNTSWLSQANMCIGEKKSKCGKRYRYGVIDELTCVLTTNKQFRHLLRPEGTLRTAHLFPCSVRIRHQGQRIGVEFPGSDQFYWSLDPSGNTRMTQDECDSTGLP